MSEPNCPACGVAAAGVYCGDCGQRQPRPGDFSWPRMVADAWGELSGSDSRLWRTLKALAVPGLLTAEWANYRGQRYLPPLRLYLLMAALFFLTAWNVWFDASVQQVLALPKEALSPLITALYFDPQTSERMGDLSALLRFVSVVGLGAFVAFLMLRTPRPVGVHLVFAVHYMTMDCVVYLLLAPAILVAPQDAQAGLSAVLMVVGMGLLGLWSLLAIRRVYGLSWGGSLWRAALVLAMDGFLSFVASQFVIVYLLLVSM